jgi:ADP-ribose pyrophosphatase YjhB (NUDIX family)
MKSLSKGMEAEMFWYPKEKDYDERDADGVTLRDFLKNYDPNKYERPAVTVDNLIFKKEGEALKILLIRRGRHPSYGKLALPGGFVEMDETLDEAAARELFEETGVRTANLAQLGAYGAVGRDPRMRIISIAYTAIVDSSVKAAAGDDAAEADFYIISLKRQVINNEKVYNLVFSFNEISVSSKVVESHGKREIAESDVASDHSIMILDALERLGLIENM